ncbi:hypothetical protein UJ101_00482 [Flavobacteriaceae bacterium UJ101]|nr:hypothetical protein UJ101_00482 [Flavobacteriaceae bacterium UJ101]
MKTSITFILCSVMVFLTGQSIQVTDQEGNALNTTYFYNTEGKIVAVSDAEGKVQDSIIFNLNIEAFLFIHHDSFTEKMMTVEEIKENPIIKLENDVYSIDEVIVTNDKKTQDDAYAVLKAYATTFLVKDGTPINFLDGIVKYYIPLNYSGKIKYDVLEYRLFENPEEQDREYQKELIPEFKIKSLLEEHKKDVVEVDRYEYKFINRKNKTYGKSLTTSKTTEITVDYIKSLKDEVYTLNILGHHLKIKQLYIQQIFKGTEKSYNAMERLKKFKQLWELDYHKGKNTPYNNYQYNQDLKIISREFITKKEFKLRKKNFKDVNVKESWYEEEFWNNDNKEYSLPSVIKNKIGTALQIKPNQYN